jgi:hypothetical protein
MKHLGSRIAYDHYDDLAEPDEHGEIKGLPDDPAPVHVLLFQPPRHAYAARGQERFEGPRAIFLDAGSYERAACGRFIKVVLPQSFNDADPDACPACARAAAWYTEDPAGFWRAQNARDWERHNREDEQTDFAVWRAREDARRHTEH